MNTLKASLDVDFIESKPFTQEEERLLSEYLQKQRVVLTAPAKRLPTLRRKKVVA
jgi:hypothetical protein